MKEFKAIEAYQTLRNFGHIKMPVASAYRIYKLVKELEQVFLKHIAFEKDLIEKYGGSIPDIGSPSFESEEKMQDCQKEISEYGNTEIDVSATPVTLDLELLGDAMLTPMEIDALDGFVNFK